MQTIKIFLASSDELKDDRNGFQILIAQLNQSWIAKDTFFNLIIWEDFVDAMSKTGLQSEYNKAIQEADIFVLLFFTKVGKFSKEEFNKAFGAFRKSAKPLVYTYFKDDMISTGKIGDEIKSLLEFKEMLDKRKHFYTRYKSTEDLKWQFSRQLEKLYTVKENSLLEITTKSTPEEIDTIALALTNKVLSYSNQQPYKKKLQIAVSKSSEMARHTIYLLALQTRRSNWYANKDLMERAIPVFEALIKSDPRKDKHYYYGQLAYSLKDKRNPDCNKAKKYLDIAIEMVGGPGYDFAYYYYSFNRALCIIKTDPEFLKGIKSSPEIKKMVLRDLKAAKSGFKSEFEEMIRQVSNTSIINWLQINNIKKL